MDEKKKMTRKDFLRKGGSTIAGLSILGVAGTHLVKMFSDPGRMFYGDGGDDATVRRADDLKSPYRKVSAFAVPARIDALDVNGDDIYIAAGGNVSVYAADGTVKSSFPVKLSLRDIVFHDNRIYVLYPASVSVNDLSGAVVGGWEACSDESDYCQMTVFSEGVYVTDAQNKNICRYSLDGGFRGFIDSLDGFIVPSYSFGITNISGKVYCSNPGRHRVEVYEPDGSFVKSFGRSGADDGGFSGCCNPVHLAATPNGDIITSEKGVPRISCFGQDGLFHAVLLDDLALGRGTSAREVRLKDDLLIVAGENDVSMFRYDPAFAESTACGGCVLNCPLRKGVNV